jgi:hypothetical protein
MIFQSKFIDFTSYVVALIALAISFYIYYGNSNEFTFSFIAALMTAGLVWATYLILRWLLLANRD